MIRKLRTSDRLTNQPMKDDHHAWHLCLAWILCERRCSVMDLANWGGAKRCGFSGRGRGYAGLEEWNARVCAVRFCTGRNEVRRWMTAFVIGYGEQYAHSTPYPSLLSRSNDYYRPLIGDFAQKRVCAAVAIPMLHQYLTYLHATGWLWVRAL